MIFLGSNKKFKPKLPYFAKGNTTNEIYVLYNRRDGYVNTLSLTGPLAGLVATYSEDVFTPLEGDVVFRNE